MDIEKKLIPFIKTSLEKELPEIDEKLPQKVQHVAACIHKSLLNDNLTVSQVYRNCLIKDHNFSAKFAHYMGQTPRQYIEHYRIAVAKKTVIEFAIPGCTLFDHCFGTGVFRCFHFFEGFQT